MKKSFGSTGFKAFMAVFLLFEALSSNFLTDISIPCRKTWSGLLIIQRPSAVSCRSSACSAASADQSNTAANRPIAKPTEYEMATSFPFFIPSSIDG
jgi:hypothetical protein